MRSVDIETETPTAVQEPLVQQPAWRRYLRLIAVVVLILLALIFREPLATWVAETSWNVWLGALAQGLGFGAVALGVYLTFRVLDFPDLTIDGSFPMGAAVASALLLNGYDAYVTLPLAFFVGALAGAATGLIHTYLKINGLLASILVLTGAFTINLRIMGQSNIPLLNVDTLFTPYKPFFRELFIERWDNAWLRVHSNVMAIVIFLVIILVLKLALDWFLHTELGLAVRATGDNPQMIRALGVNTERMKILGLALSNGMVGLSGALLAQYQGFADVNSGAGLIIAGLAAVIIGETLFGRKSVARATLAVVLGMIVYRLAIAATLTINIPIPGRDAPFRMEATDVKLATALLVLVALAIPRIQQLRRKDV